MVLINQFVLCDTHIFQGSPQRSITYDNNHSFQPIKFIIEKIIQLHIAGNTAIIVQRNGDMYMYYLRNKIREIEKIFYLSICPKEDAEKILGIKKMSCEDFERINYIVNSLELDYFEIELSETFCLQSAELAEKSENKMYDRFLLEEIANRYTRWSDEFVKQVQNPNLRLYLKEKLERV